MRRNAATFVERLVESTSAVPDRPTIVATVLHARSRSDAGSDRVCLPLGSAHGVWLTGGRQHRLTERYGGTRAVSALREVLARGGVVGGSGAGARDS